MLLNSVWFFSFIALSTSQIIGIPLHYMKSVRHEMAEVGFDEEDEKKFFNPSPKPKPHNDSIALFKYLDSEFYGIIGLGHPAQNFKVVFDTAWSNAWVPSVQCSVLSIPCALHDKYNSKASSTYSENGTSFEVDVGGGNELKGFLSTDILHISHLTLNKTTFAEIVQLPLAFSWDKADGIIGLSYSTLSVDGVVPVFYSLVKEKIIAEPIFSFYFNRDRTSPRGGNMFLGGSDKKHINGSFTYLPVIEKAYWKIHMDRAEVDIYNKTKPFCISGCNVILDTSTITITAPSKEALKINELVGVTSYWLGRGKVPCKLVQKLPPIKFVFAGKDFKLAPRDYVQEINKFGLTLCLSAFVAGNSEDWVIGGAFMGQYYTEFDLGLNRVGFAMAK